MEGAMNDKVKKTKNAGSKKSRRDFLKTAAVAGGTTAAVLGFPGGMRLSAAEPINIKMQTAWDAGTLGYVKFQDFCKRVGEITEGKLTVEGFPAWRLSSFRGTPGCTSA